MRSNRPRTPLFATATGSVSMGITSASCCELLPQPLQHVEAAGKLGDLDIFVRLVCLRNRPGTADHCGNPGGLEQAGLGAEGNDIGVSLPGQLADDGACFRKGDDTQPL